MNKRILSLVLAVATLCMSLSAVLSPIAFAAGEEFVINECDSLDGWTKTGGNGLTVSDNPARSQNSKAAIECNVNMGAFRTATYTAPAAMDLSGYEAVEWDAMFFASGDSTGKMWNEVKAAYGTDGNNTLLLKLTSGSDANYAVWRLSKLQATQPYANRNWVHFKALLADPNTNNNFDPAACTKFYFASCDGAVVSTVSNGQIRLDNIKATGKASGGETPGDEPGDDDGEYPIPGKYEKTTQGTFSFTSTDFEYDLSKYGKADLFLTMDLTVTNTDGTEDLSDLTSEGQIELTSSGKSDVQELSWQVPRIPLKSGLNRVRISFADANFDNGFDLSKVNFFRFYSRKAGESQFQITIENILITTKKEERIVGTYFSDGMMFLQNQPIPVRGNVKTAGVEVKAILYKNGEAMEELTAVSDEQGDWSVSSPARKGSYDVYKIELVVAGKTEVTINDIVIGELWLAAGQSNMEFALGQTVSGNDYSDLLNSNVRFYEEPAVPGGVDAALSASPLTDVEGAKWANGANAADIKYVSAIAYRAALQLQQELNVPVGFIDSAKGASVIESWLPRKAVEENAAVKATLENRGIYYTEEELGQISQNWKLLTTLYNTKIAPLAGIPISGVMWYQGESNVKYADADGYNTFYQNALTELIAAYSDLFGFEAGTMPFICAHLAPYNNASVREDYVTVQAAFSEMLHEVAKTAAARMIELPIYDLPLTYKDPPATNFDPIHPSNKKPVAERFAAAMLAGVYGIGNQDAASAPGVSGMKIAGNKITLTFNHVGDGLQILNGETTLHGFAVADASRVFTEAQAKIVSADTVEVWSDHVAAPVAATYAWASFNMLSNLGNAAGIPAVPYRSDRTESTYLLSSDWGYFDSDTLWQPLTTAEAGFTNAYTAESGTVLSFTAEGAKEGRAHMKVDYTASAAFAPVLEMGGMINQLPAYTGLTVYVKNPDARAKKLAVEITAGGETYRAAITEGTALATEYTVPAGSEYTAYTFHFKRLVNPEGKVLQDSTVTLKTLSALRFLVTDTAAGTVYVDHAYLRADDLPTPGAENDELIEGAEDTTPGSVDKEGNMWFSDAETQNGWAATGAAIVNDSEKVTQGKASVGTTGAGGVLRQIMYKPGTALDVSAYDYLEFDVYYSNMQWFANKDVMFELTSAGTSDNESNRYMKGYLNTNAPELYEAGMRGETAPAWYHVKLDLHNPQTIARGGMDPTRCNYFRFFTLGAPEGTPDFEIRFDNMKFTKKAAAPGNENQPGGNKYGDPSYGVVIDGTSMWMSTVETAIWWKASGAEAMLDNQNKTQGETSIMVTAKNGVLKQLAFLPDHALDISDYQYLEFDAYFTNLDWLRDCGGMMFELTSAGTCDVESSRYTKSSILEACPALAADYESGASGGKWYHFKLNLSTPHSKVKGGLNLQKFNYFRFYTVQPKSTTADYTLYLDKMMFTKGEAPAAIVKTPEKIVINAADSAALWTSPGQEVMLDTKNKVSGTGSVSVTAKGGILKELAYHPAEPIDLTGYPYLQFDLFLSDITCLGVSTGFMVEVTSSGTCDKESNRFMKSGILAACPELAQDLAAGVKGNKWYHFCFNLEKPQNQARGGLNMKAMNFFRIYFIGAPAGTPDCVVNVDNLEATAAGKGGTQSSSGGQSIVISSGGSAGKNVGNKVNMGLVSNPLTEIPEGLIRTAVMLGAATVAMAIGLVIFLIILLAKRRKKDEEET